MNWEFWKKTGPFWVAAAITTFLTWKLSHLAFRFGDGNAYIYMADALWHGLLPYRDFFLADPPVLVLLLAALKPVLGQNLVLYQAIPLVLEALSALLLYLLLRRAKNPFAPIAPALYLFSFTVLTTSDFLTGVQLVIFFSLLALWLAASEKPVLAGAAWSLAILTKLYALPAFAGFLVYAFWKNREQFWKLVLGSGAAGVAVMAPFLFLAWPKVWEFLVVHQFHRPAGNSRAAVWGFFWAREWALLLTGLAGAALSRRLSLLLPGAAIGLFFVLYQDLYYLYLDNLFFYLVAFTLLFMGILWEKKNQAVWALLVTLAVTTAGAIMSYKTDYGLRGRFLNAAEVADAVRQLPENLPLYGSHEVAPLVSLLSARPLFDNVIDTNGQAFASGAQDREAVSARAAEKGVYMIARITDWPEQDLRDYGYQSFFSETVFTAHCQRAAALPSTSNETDNLIVVYKCQK